MAWPLAARAQQSDGGASVLLPFAEGDPQGQAAAMGPPSAPLKIAPSAVGSSKRSSMRIAYDVSVAIFLALSPGRPGVFLLARAALLNVRYWHKADMSAAALRMSAFGGKADIAPASQNVRL